MEEYIPNKKVRSMKRILFIILGTLCFAIAGKAQGSDVSVQKKNTGYSILNDTVEAVKDSMTFEQRVEMINRMKLKQDTKLLRYVAGITGGLCDVAVVDTLDDESA